MGIRFKSRNGWCLALLINAVAAPLALGDTFNYTAQTRSVYSRTAAGGNGPSQTISASNFGDFDQTALTQIVPPGPPGYASQHQHSILGPDSITISGDFTGDHPIYAGTGIAEGKSSTSITFTVSQTTGAYLSVWAQYTGPSMDYNFLVYPNIRLRTPSTPPPHYLLYWELPDGGYPASVFDMSQDLLLTPDTYTLDINFESSITFQQSFTVPSFKVVLAVPEPASLSLAIPCLLLLKRRSRSR